MTWDVSVPDDPAARKTLSLNGRPNYYARNSAAQRLKDAAYAAVLEQHPFVRLDQVHVTVTFVPPDKRRRDLDNLIGCVKPIVDGIVRSRLLPDDNHTRIRQLAVRMGAVDREHPRWVINLEEVN